jgi:cytochrome b
MTIAVAAKRFSWDPVVKITHWSIALAVLVNAVFTEEGSSLHVWVGYGLAAILALRLLWGLIGPPEARFRAFWPSPRKALDHIRDIRNGTLTRHSSHNPLGATMVYAIWACLLTIIGTGVAMAGVPRRNDAASEDGQRAAYESRQFEEHSEDESEGENDELLEEVHEVAANLLYVLILLHLAGVLFETRRSGSKVLVAMSPLHR